MVRRAPSRCIPGALNRANIAGGKIAKTALWPDRVVVFAPERHCFPVHEPLRQTGSRSAVHREAGH